MPVPPPLEVLAERDDELLAAYVEGPPDGRGHLERG